MQQNRGGNCFIIERSDFMSTSLVQTEKEFTQIYEQYVDMVYRICFLYFRNQTDTEDAVQNVFFKLLMSTSKFTDENHRKAWLIVTASNECKNHVKHWWKKKVLFRDFDVVSMQTKDETLEFLLSLPDKYKTVLYCYYYEGYHTNEIAHILHMKESTVRSYLHRGRNYLRELLEEGENEESKNHSSIQSSSPE